MQSADVSGSGDDAYVNYLDIKLHEVLNVPPEWYESAAPVPAAVGGAANKDGHANTGSVAGTAPAYNLHPFRYDVTLQWPGAEAPALTTTTATVESSPINAFSSRTTEPGGPSVSASATKKNRKGVVPANAAAETSIEQTGEASATTDAQHPHPPPAGGGSAAQTLTLFRYGRLLTPLPSYTRYIERSLPVGCDGDDDDVRPVRDVPVVLEEALIAAKERARENGGTDVVEPGALVGTDDAAAASMPAPVLLWVCTEATSIMKDPSQSPPAADSAAARRRQKKAGTSMAAIAASGAGAGQGAAGVGGSGAMMSDALAPPPALPDAQERPPCVVRLPLTAAVERHLRSLVRSGEPLVLTMRRTLKPNAPPEWEDVSAPYYTADIRIPLSALAEPGSTSVHLRVPLTPSGGTAEVTHPEGAFAATTDLTSVSGSAGAGATASASANQDLRRKKVAARKALKVSGLPALLCEVPDVTAPHPYLRAGTTALLSVSVVHTLTRLPQDRVRPGIMPAQLLPAQAIATAQKGKATAEMVLDGGMGPFSDALEAIAQQLFAEFVEFATQQQQQLKNDEEGGVERSTRALFMSFIQSSGRLAAYKQQLVPLVVDMAQHARAAGSAGQDVGVVQLTSHLYVALLERTHHILREVAREGDDSPPPHRTSPNGTALTPLSWCHLAEEAELVDDFATAEGCLQARISQAASSCGSGGASDLSHAWVDLADLYCRWERGHAHKAEACYREALSLEPANVRGLRHYGLFLLARHRHEEAEVYLQCAVDARPDEVLSWACVSVLFDVKLLDHASAGRAGDGDVSAIENERRYAIRKVEEALAIQHHAAEHTSGAASDAATSPSTAVDERVPQAESKAYLDVAHCALQLHHRGLAAIALARVSQGCAADAASAASSWRAHTERLYAHLFLQGGQYTEARRAVLQCRTALAAITTTGSAPGPDEALEAELKVLEAWCALGDVEEYAAPHPQAHIGVDVDVAPAVTSAVSTEILDALKAALCLASDRRRGDEEPEVDLQRATRLAGSPTARDTTGTDVRDEACTAPPTWWLAAYVRLSNLLTRRSRYRDALGVLVIALRRWPQSALLWMASGTAYLRLGDYGSAEACLGEASRLDSGNPRTWALIALTHLYAQSRGSGSSVPGTVVVAAVEQAHQHGLEDAALEAELGKMCLVCGHVNLAETCLRRSLQLTTSPACKDGHSRSTRADAAALTAPVTYHLAHALMAGGQAKREEAMALLQSVEAAVTAPAALRVKAQDDQRRLAGDSRE